MGRVVQQPTRVEGLTVCPETFVRESAGIALQPFHSRRPSDISAGGRCMSPPQAGSGPDSRRLVFRMLVHETVKRRLRSNINTNITPTLGVCRLVLLVREYGPSDSRLSTIC